MLLLFVLGTLLILALLGYATYQSGKLLNSVPLRDNLLLAPVENLVKGVLVVVCVALALASGLPADLFGWASASPFTQLAAGIMAGLATHFVATLITPWAISHWGKSVYSTVVIKNIYPRSRREWLLAPAAMFLAVLLEEVLFRSLLLGGFSAFVPGALLVAGLAIVFGLMHSAQGPLGMVVSAVIGVEFSLLFLWSGSLLVPLVAHYTVNMLQLLRAHEEWRWIEEY